MLEPLDYARRDQGMMYLGRSLRDFLPEDHLLLQLEAAIDLRPLVAPLKDAYCPDNGRPGVHPEILVRALLISRLYGIPSFRQLCRDLSYNLAYRYFCHLPLDQAVFDHSTITRFLDRVGREAFDGLCQELTALLARQDFLTEDTYLDSTLVAVGASADGLGPTRLSAESFAEAVVEANGLFLGPSGPEPDAPVAVYQDHRGRLPLAARDPDARWAKGARGPAFLAYKVSALTEDHGFIVGQRVDHATVVDHQAGEALLSGLPPPRTLAADKAYSAGAFRAALRQRGTTAYIPLPHGHPPAFLHPQGFVYGPFTLTCPEGLPLQARHRLDKDTVRYRARRQECRGCPRVESCPAARRGGFELGADTRELVRAQAVNGTAAYRRAQRRRRAVAEGVFAHLKALGMRRVKLRGLARMAIAAALAALAHNLLKLLKLKRERPQPVEALSAASLTPTCRHQRRRRSRCQRTPAAQPAFSTDPLGFPLPAPAALLFAAAVGTTRRTPA